MSDEKLNPEGTKGAQLGGIDAAPEGTKEAQLGGIDPAPEGTKEAQLGGIDPAALAAATLASAVATIAPSGPYGPASIIFGAAILLLIFGYDIRPNRYRRQSLAFAAVVALVAVLALGYPMECIFSEKPLDRLHVLKLDRDPDTDIKHSEVPPYVTIAIWTGFTLIAYRCDRIRIRRNRKDGDKSK